MSTEKELIYLNQEVYKVDPDYKDNGNKIKYTDKTNSQLEKNVIQAGNQNFKILSVKNGAYGFQGMAVAPIIEGIFNQSQAII
ncbi:hypothetical protein ACSFB8_08565 [Enterococcus faecalis]